MSMSESGEWEGDKIFGENKQKIINSWKGTGEGQDLGSGSVSAFGSQPKRIKFR